MTHGFQILATPNGDPNSFVATGEGDIDALSIVRHTSATPIASMSGMGETRGPQRKLVEYARRLNAGREEWAMSQQRISEMRERWLRKKTLSGMHHSIY